MASPTQSRVEGQNANVSGQKHRPVWTKKGFPLTVAVFEFPSVSGPPNFSVKITRSFRREQNAPWENSRFIGGSDLLRAVKLLEAADAFVQSRLEATYRSSN